MVVGWGCQANDIVGYRSQPRLLRVAYRAAVLQYALLGDCIEDSGRKRTP